MNHQKYHSANARKEEPKPSFYCRDCGYNCDKRCSFFSRPIEPDYNRCFNHTNYFPVSTAYREPENLVELIEKEEELQVA